MVVLQSLYEDASAMSDRVFENQHHNLYINKSDNFPGMKVAMHKNEKYFQPQVLRILTGFFCIKVVH